VEGIDYWLTKVAPGYSQQMKKINKGGVYTLVSDRLATTVVESGTLMEKYNG
jgi:hypothetical protein